MGKSNKVYVKHQNVLKPGWDAKVDDNAKLKVVKKAALAKEHPQAADHIFNEEIDQFKEATKILQAPTKLLSKNKKEKVPSLKRKFLGEQYGKQDKDADEDDIQHITSKRKRDQSASSVKRKAGGDVENAAKRPKLQEGEGSKLDDNALQIMNSVKPFHTLLDELEKEKDDPGDHVFPMKKLKCMDYLWTCQGKRRTGKTTTWKNVFPRFAHAYPYVYFFAQTRFAGQFEQYAPTQAIHKGFSEAVLWKLMSIQETKIKTNLRLYDYWSQYEDPEMLVNIPNPYVYFLWDDTIGGKLVHDSEVLNEIAYFGRHYRTSGWINTQHGHAIHPGFRANTDVASMCIKDKN